MPYPDAPPFRTTPVPNSLFQTILTSAYTELYIVPPTKQTTTVRGMVISNGDVVAGVPTPHRVWLHLVPPLPAVPDFTNQLLFDQEFLNGIDFDGVLVMNQGWRLMGKADVDGLIAIGGSGAENVTEVLP